MAKETIEDDQLDELIENLKDSNKSIEEAILDEFGIEGGTITSKQRNTLYNELFQCSDCDYWFDKSEEDISTGSQSVCEGCSPQFRITYDE